MKPFNCSCNIKRNLVNITIIVALSFSTSFLSYSNPVVSGPCILEIYFGPEGWQIEMKNTMYFEKIPFHRECISIPWNLTITKSHPAK